MPPPPKAAGGVMVPPRDWGTLIEQLRSDHRAELDRLEQGLLALERRTFEQGIAIDNLSAELEGSDGLEGLRRRLEHLERESWSDDRLEAMLQRAQARPISETPDGITEVKTPGGTRVRAPWWVAIVLGLLVTIVVAMWQAKELAEIIRLAK